ncbi:hypothetical protein D3X58_19570, partial [Acinetobacter baumannii]|uniref:hypothetical protein n=1 Tax=Acinetobacter baumannii TaxID=470 RepID=UPI000EE2414F
NDFTLKVPTMEGIHLLYLEINKIFSLSCQPICNSASDIGRQFLMICSLMVVSETMWMQIC